MKNKEVFKNQDLVLTVDKNIDPSVLNLNKYESFLDALCSSREYQKEAIREAVKFLLGGRYKNIKDLAEENYHKNENLQEKYPNEKDFYKILPIADKLNCSIDLATGTGKSYVMYGIAQIMLCEGAVDRVLVLCPSLTIEDGLTEKFEDLSGNKILKEVLPKGSKSKNPGIVNGSETIEKGDICIENIHAVYENNKSSIRDSFENKGDRTLCLSDEVHHVYSPINKDLKKWESFLTDSKFNFKYLVGLSGTCYIKDEYFSNVVYRYSLKTAIEEKQVKDIQYVYEDQTKNLNEDTKFQEIYQIHQDNKKKYNKIKPLTILITKDIKECKNLIGKFQRFLKKEDDLSMEQAEAKTLIVTSSPEHEANRAILKKVDSKSSKVEFIFSVSMLTEGWDVKNVLQIVPHEKRAFDSKLLISQVLGRGLRIPNEYNTGQPAVRIFNHDKWYPQIKGLVDEVLEREKRIYSYVVKKSKDYNFVIHNIKYDKNQTEKEYKKKGGYEFKKNFFTYSPQSKINDSEIIFESVSNPVDHKTVKVKTKTKMYEVDYVVNEIKNKISLWSDDDGIDYMALYPEERIEEIIKNSLNKIKEKKNIVSEENLQKTLQGFGVIRRPSSKFKVIRFEATKNDLFDINTNEIEKNSISLSSLSKEGAIFYDDNTLKLSEENEFKIIKDIEKEFDEGSSKLNTACKNKISNSFNFKNPLNLILVSHKPEREFVKNLVKEENAKSIDAWIKSRDTGFYTIEYSWRKGEHPKNGQFNPDFFIKIGKNILIIETKIDKDITDENKGKVEYAKKHIIMLNKIQNKQTYYFWMISPQDYDNFFKKLRDGKWVDFVSTLEIDLEQI
ncbi:MAG: DEAD/DEAH box helicase family protein [Candidatus Paceibacterota bacterium]|jgi:type III restriction enzyme